MAKDELVRISISIEKSLLDQIDSIIQESGAENRSEAIRDLIRGRLLDHTAGEGEAEGVGTVTLVYDHNKRNLADKLIETGHEHHHEVMASMHVHLDHDRCLEVVALRGRRSLIRRVADSMIAMKGVQYGKLVLAATAAPPRQHSHGSFSHTH